MIKYVKIIHKLCSECAASIKLSQVIRRKLWCGERFSSRFFPTLAQRPSYQIVKRALKHTHNLVYSHFWCLQIFINLRELPWMTNYHDPRVHREHIFIFVAYSSSSLHNLLMQKSCLYKLFKIVKVDTKVFLQLSAKITTQERDAGRLTHKDRKKSEIGLMCDIKIYIYGNKEGSDFFIVMNNFHFFVRM